jgi:parvulin-like peptidyl-prolyl isomerase
MYRCIAFHCSFLVTLIGSATADEPAVLTVAATVEQEPIYAGEVADLIRRLGLGKKISKQDRPRLKAQILDQLIDERIGMAYLRRHKAAISDHHVDAAVAEIRSKVEQRKSTLENYLQQRGFTEKALRAQLAWRMSWEKYIEKRVTDEVLKKFFEGNRKGFDGTKVRVAHILLRVEKPSDVGAVKAMAAKIREEIVAGETTFEAAAAKHSSAPTAKQGGEIGLISRNGEMVEAFSVAAFALKKGAISQPVVSPFGVHLIQCIDIQPGKKKWSDVRDQLRSAVIQRGFRRIVEAERPRVKIKFTGRAAHFDPDSGKLVAPAMR